MAFVSNGHMLNSISDLNIVIKAKLFIIRYNVRKSYYDIINFYISDDDVAAGVVATVMVTAKIRLRPTIECAACQH